MDKTSEDAPPSTDLAGWRRAVGNGCFRAFRMESVVAAIQDLGPTTDKTVMTGSLIDRLSHKNLVGVSGSLSTRSRVYNRSDCGQVAMRPAKFAKAQFS